MTKYHRYILLLLAIVPAIAAPRDKADGPAFRPAAVSPVLKSEMARYSLKAYENRDQTNAVKGLLFSPKPVGMNELPMIVYIPGNGEIGGRERVRLDCHSRSCLRYNLRHEKISRQPS